MKIFGPYKGSKQNGGRPIYVIKRKKKDGTTETTSTNKARKDYEKATGKKLKKSVDVDHKDNGGRAGRDGIKNLQTMTHKKNVAKENKRRAK
jgi:mRNA-degrading endonuclease toxin of MazEF toxin-antitoxin module